MTFILSKEAKKDIDDIWDYTFDNWGELQADKYTTELENRFEWLTENPHLGEKRDEVKEGYLSYFQGSHTIFYRQTKDGIEILGIPHQNEDVIQHLGVSL